MATLSTNKFMPRSIDKVFHRGIPGNVGIKQLLLRETPEYQAWFDHFLGGSVDAKYPAVGGTGTPARAIVAGAGTSQMKLTTTTVSGDSATQALALMWAGNNYCYAACQLQLDVITTAKFEFGFADALTQVNGAVGTKATPTANATDAAVFCFDTTHNTNLDFFTVSNGTILNQGTSATALVAATNIILEVRVENGQAAGYVNGQRVGGGAGPRGTIAVTPWLQVQTRTTAARNLSVDWLYVAGPYIS